MSKSFKPHLLTEEQKKILEAVHRGESLIKVNAFAGTGKTFTLTQIAHSLPKYYKGLYLAFNKSIQEEAKTKFPSNIKVKTTHGLAYYYIIIRKMRNQVKVGPEFRPLEITNIFGTDIQTSIEIVNRLNSFFNSNIDEITTLNDSMLESEVVEVCNLLLNNMRQGFTDRVTHSFYLKEFELALKNKKIKNFEKFDIVFLDEAQDTNDVTLSIFNNIPAKQKILVGDRHQQIYAFRGSVNAMNKIKTKNVYYLTHSFRFPQKIANRASTFLKIFKNEKKPLVGKGKESDKIKTKAYLSRTNAKLIEKMLEIAELIDIGKNTNFKTIRHPDMLFGLVLNLIKFFNGEEVEKEYQYLNNINSIEKYSEVKTLEDKLTLMAYDTNDVELLGSINLINKFGEFRILDIYEIAKDFYKKLDNRNVDWFLSTAHTSKGLEWDYVELADDFDPLDIITKWYIFNLFYNKNITREAIFKTKDKILKENNQILSDIISKIDKDEIAYIALANELNLYYVAITRAKQEFVSTDSIEFLYQRFLREKTTEKWLIDKINEILISKILNELDVLIKKTSN